MISVTRYHKIATVAVNYGMKTVSELINETTWVALVNNKVKYGMYAYP